MSSVRLRGVCKSYGSTEVLHDLDLDIADGSVTAILGPSGSGKTTLLRLIAGFERAELGTITIGDTTVDDGRRAVPPQHRGLGYVPQEGALFPNLTIAGNVLFGLRRARRDAARLGELLDLVGLAGLEHRYPHQLSGGQQQRVALARALAIEPQVVLLDEPFSSLDAALRVSLRRDVVKVLAQTATTAILVTHDQDEALSMADHVALLDAGRITHFASPAELYQNPAGAAAARFLGDANFLRATVTGSAAAHTILGDIDLRAPIPDPGTEVEVLIRPEQLVPQRMPGTELTEATVEDADYHGHETLLRLRAEPGGEQLIARVGGEHGLLRGTTVWLRVRGTGVAYPVAQRSAVEPAERIA
ncbi:MAG TPA: ABC transporter ATP-binding protein [Jatrophihabitantaceae bacterium]|jgi:iron(III) transport system ATP-binding protein|nr:ABC transporter ATP-binding protein [Jatrophihabitantaceae bacterium]